MSTQVLLELHGAGILSDAAYDVLESELRNRGVRLPTRPNEEKPFVEVDKKKRSSVQHKILIFTISMIFAGTG
jgi:hypothetical protein